jgi:hypothetical protein
MSRSGSDGKSPDSDDDVLRGTTLRIYRYMYKQGKPVGLREIQRALGLSSASIPQYHINKLIAAGLVQHQANADGYSVDRLVFENMIRIRRSLIPFQTTYTIFFSTTLFILLTILRPSVLSATYLFAIATNIAAIGVFASQAYRTLRKRNTI